MCRECPSLLSVPRLTVLYGDGGEASKQIEKERRDLGLVTKLHSPPLPLQWGTHHSKIALLIYENCLRVCIRTFNDVFPDVHQKSNAMYLQDFPGKSPESLAYASKSEDDFGNDFKLQLFKYFGKCGGFDAAELDRYDFSTAAVAIVSSVPGYHSGQQLSDWGQLRLKQLLARHVKIEAEQGGASRAGMESSVRRAPLATCPKNGWMIFTVPWRPQLHPQRPRPSHRCTWLRPPSRKSGTGLKARQDRQESVPLWSKIYCMADDDLFGYIWGTKWHELSLNISYFDVHCWGTRILISHSHICT